MAPAEQATCTSFAVIGTASQCTRTVPQYRALHELIEDASTLVRLRKRAT
jgi:hypothetical protein